MITPFRSHTPKTAFVTALEHYFPSIIKNHYGYLTSHINEICNSQHPTLKDSYADRASGYTSYQVSMTQIMASNSPSCKKIQYMSKSLCTNDDFIVVDNTSTTPPPPNTPNNNSNHHSILPDDNITTTHNNYCIIC